MPENSVNYQRDFIVKTLLRNRSRPSRVRSAAIVRVRETQRESANHRLSSWHLLHLPTPNTHSFDQLRTNSQRWIIQHIHHHHHLLRLPHRLPHHHLRRQCNSNITSKRHREWQLHSTLYVCASMGFMQTKFVSS